VSENWSEVREFLGGGADFCGLKLFIVKLISVATPVFSNVMHASLFYCQGFYAPGKSWIFPKISRTWKVLGENALGPGKSWNLPVVEFNQHAFYAENAMCK